MSENSTNSNLTQEERLKKLYGNNLPSKSEILSNKLKDRKFFDSGDYALNKAGLKTNLSDKILTPEQISRVRSSVSGASSNSKSQLENEIKEK